MRDRFFLYIRSAAAAVKIVLKKVFNPRSFRSPLIQDISLSAKILMRDRGRIFLGRHIHTKRGVVFEASGGMIDIGEGSFFNNGCMVVSKDRIKIGKNTAIGPNVMIYDHDHNIHSSLTLHNSGYVSSPVIIGDNVWIGANSVILRGTTLGSGSVVGAGSVIKGDYPPGSVIIQKRVCEVRSGMESEARVSE